LTPHMDTPPKEFWFKFNCLIRLPCNWRKIPRN
jgi:hypothetical protein